MVYELSVGVTWCTSKYMLSVGFAAYAESLTMPL